MTCQILLEAVEFIHGQRNNITVHVDAHQDDRAGQVVLAAQFQYLRRVVAEHQGAVRDVDTSIIFIKAGQDAGGFVQRDNGKFHVRCDGGEIDFAVLPAILHDSQDAHINSDFFRTDGTGSVVHRLFSFVCKRKRPNRVFQYSIVSVHSHAAVCAASVPAA